MTFREDDSRVRNARTDGLRQHQWITGVAGQKVANLGLYLTAAREGPRREVQEYLLLKFSQWKNHEAINNPFDRLLSDLKPELEHKPEVR